MRPDGECGVLQLSSAAWEVEPWAFVGVIISVCSPAVVR